MDLMLLSVSVLTVVVTLTGGYFLIHKLFPNSNMELEITNAFKQENYNKVIAMTEGKENSLRHSMNIYVCAAQSRKANQMYDEAIKWWETALVKLHLSTLDQVYIELEVGDVYLAMKNHKLAELHYRTALSLSPNHEPAHYKLGNVLYLDNKLDACRQLLRPVLTKNPSLLDTRFLYAECLASLSLYAKAVRHYAFLERHNEDVKTFNYATTLKKLKIFDKAYELFSQLLSTTHEPNVRESIIYNLVKISMDMKKYPDSLGLIEKYLYTIESSEIKLDLKYMRATIFFLRGDQMIALKEYADLHQENPFYKDLNNIITNNQHLLKYTFLFNYFTSNEMVFETLINRILLPGLSIVRRTAGYFIVESSDSLFVFYRDMRKITDNVLKEIDHFVFLQYPDVELLELWCLEGIEGRYTMTGRDYRLILRTGDDFLVQINQAVSQMEHIEGGEPLNFVEGFKDIPEVIPVTPSELPREKTQDQTNQHMMPLLDTILGTENKFIEDELISRALE